LELASLEAKLLRARQQRQTTREKCQSVTAAAERLRLRCQAAKESTKRCHADDNKVSAQQKRALFVPSCSASHRFSHLVHLKHSL
jgi:hypothetical protein